MISRKPFDEGLHPRGFGGKFGHGTGTAKAKPAKAAKKVAAHSPDFWGFKPPAKGKGPKPIPRPKAKSKPSLKVSGGDGGARPSKPKPAVPFAFTDESYAAHAKMLEQRTRELKASGVDSRSLYTVRNPDGSLSDEWKPERRAQQEKILQQFLDSAKDVPREGKAIFAGGLGGAGKGTVLRDSAGIPDGQYLTVNPDLIKEAMARANMIPAIDGMSPMEANTLVHEESSTMAKKLAQLAAEQKINMIWDITMSSDSSVQSRIDALREAGYTDINGLFVNIDVPTSRARAESRHRSAQQKYENGEGNGGRFLPPEETAKNEPTPGSGKASHNAEVFDRLAPQFGSTVVYNNMVERGKPPIVESTTGPQWDAHKPAGQPLRWPSTQSPAEKAAWKTHDKQQETDRQAAKAARMRQIHEDYARKIAGPGEVFPQMTYLEEQAVMRYVGGEEPGAAVATGSQDLNRALRTNPDNLNPEDAEERDLIDSALSKSTLDKATTVMRTAPVRAELLANADNPDYRFIEPAYMSTEVEGTHSLADLASRYDRHSPAADRVFLRLELPAGTPGLDIGTGMKDAPAGNYFKTLGSDEGEVLLPRGTSWQVVGVKRPKGSAPVVTLRPG